MPKTKPQEAVKSVGRKKTSDLTLKALYFDTETIERTEALAKRRKIPSGLLYREAIHRGLKKLFAKRNKANTGVRPHKTKKGVMLPPADCEMVSELVALGRHTESEYLRESLNVGLREIEEEMKS